MKVTFFGHADAPHTITEPLTALLRELIQQGADVFYIGNHGDFDHIVTKILGQLKLQYPHIRYSIVLSYMPHGKNLYNDFNTIPTILPESVASTIPRFAITKRNHWMLAEADIVITYVTRAYGGAASFKKIAIQRGKKIYEISELQ